MNIFLASHNRGKVRQLQSLLGRRWRLLALPVGAVLPYETGTTYRENALLKARAVAEITGGAALADDSGLEVAALDGAPGVHSARFAGDEATDGENNAKLLRELAGVGEAHRGAEFVSVLCLLLPGRPPVYGEGRVNGRILDEGRGRGGFGYDPLFLHPDTGRTFAEMTSEEKDRLSHRGRAVAALLEELDESL